MGQGVAKGVVFAGKLGVAKLKGPKPEASDSKTTRILKLQGTIEDDTTRLCAALSAWVYSAKRDIVTIKDATMKKGQYCNTAAAYRNSENFNKKEDGFIPNGRVLPKIGSGEFVEEGKPPIKYVKLRFLGMAVYVKEKHTQRPKSHAVLEDEDTAKEITSLLEGHGLLPKGTTVELARFRSNGALLPSGVTVVLKRLDEEGRPDFAVIVCWQGTQADLRPMDIFTDVCGVPVRAPLWHRHYPGLLVHNGMNGIMQDEFLEHRQDLLDRLKGIYLKYKNAGEVRLVFTGHSLGGGIALLAHMASMLEVEDPSKQEELRALERVELCSIVFAAPMVFYVPDLTEKKYKDLQERFRKTSLNYIFDKDIVPRLPGNHSFAVPAIKLAATSLVREIAAQQVGIAKDSSCLDLVADLVRGGSSMFLDGSTTASTLEALRHFCHLSTLQHWTVNLDDPADTLTISDGQSLGDAFEPDGEDYKYFLACHSFFPSNILEPSDDPK